MAATATTPATVYPPLDRIHAALLAGAPLDFLPVIDLHGHFGTSPWACARPMRDPDFMLREMDRYGVDVVVCSATAVGAAGSFSRANDDVLGAMRTAPGRILGYCTLSSNRPERNLDELKRCYDLGLRCGVKMHRYDQPEYRINDPFLNPVFEFLNEHQLIYLNHDLGRSEDIVEVARRFPDMIIMNGHGGQLHAQLGERHRNVFANSCSMMGVGDIEHLVAKYGSGQLTLGSDFSLFQLGWGIGPVAYARLAEADKAAILGGNALAMFRQMAWWVSDPLPALAKYGPGSQCA